VYGVDEGREMARANVLGVWAHPDDEAYLSGGYMADRVRASHRVVSVTATRGEAGSRDEGRWAAATMAQVREAELDEALRMLGVSEHHWLGYPDGGCNLPAKEAITKVAAIIEAVEPEMVLMFGPEGMTGHPDHIAVCNWTTAAFGRSAPGDARLCYATVSPELSAEYVELLNRFDLYAPGTPTVTPVEELVIDFEVTPELMDLKIEAVRAQVSQSADFFAVFGDDFFREIEERESFRAGRPPGPSDGFVAFGRDLRENEASGAQPGG
jgi:LmbE family N-acetylglucosaminyl deacetylase